MALDAQEHNNLHLNEIWQLHLQNAPEQIITRTPQPTYVSESPYKTDSQYSNDSKYYYLSSNNFHPDYRQTTSFPRIYCNLVI